MKKRPQKKAPPVSGGGNDSGGAQPPNAQPKTQRPVDEGKSSFEKSRQSLKDLDGSLLGLMIRNARGEIENALDNWRRKLIADIKEKRLTSENVPAKLRDPDSFVRHANLFAVSHMAEYLMAGLIRRARDPHRGDADAVEILYSLTLPAAAALRDIITGYSGTNAQRERLAEHAKYDSAFPVTVRRHATGNKDVMQALDRMGLGEKSWISTGRGAKFGVGSPINRYLVRLIPHLQRFCEFATQSPKHNLLVAVPNLDHCSNPQQAQDAFDNARAIFCKTGKPVKKTAMEWVKRVIVPLIEAGYGDPDDDPVVPRLPDKKLLGLSESDKTNRSSRERLAHYVFMAFKGMLKE
jgi:hypothetical protein